jgi:uncharacterized protein YeaO (DUF488 family)
MGHRSVRVKRVYLSPADDDGTRILVDRIWPRGLTKEHAAVDVWLKDVAPSASLRSWFGHDPAKWTEFRARYAAELTANGSEVGRLRAILAEGDATLLYASKDETHNNAVVLLAFLKTGTKS